MQIKALLIAAFAMTFSAAAAYAETIDPAQAIAQKFSEASEAKPAPPERSFDRPGADYERDMLQRAKAEELERQREDAQQLAAKSAEPEPALTLAPPPSQEPSPAPHLMALPTRLAAPPTVQPSNLTPELTALSPKAAAPLFVQPPSPELRPEPQPELQPGPQLAALPSKAVAAEPPSIVPEAPGPKASQATVLLVLDPNGRGIGFKPDPIICMDNRCWISNGIGLPAVSMPRNQAVALQTTETATGDSCTGKSGCVYRNVTIDPRQRVDVIEVGEGGGASAGAYTVVADQSCRKEGEALACDNGLATQNFRMWVVPESTAETVGLASLENAVAGDLPEPDVASANDK